MRGLDSPAFDFFNIDGVNAVDKSAIPFILGIEIRTETAVDEDVDDVAEPNEGEKRDRSLFPKSDLSLFSLSTYRFRFGLAAFFFFLAGFFAVFRAAGFRAGLEAFFFGLVLAFALGLGFGFAFALGFGFGLARGGLGGAAGAGGAGSG